MDKVVNFCLICKNSLINNGINIYKKNSKYSKTPLINILNNIQKLEPVEPLQNNGSGCRNCVSILNKYDFTIVSANKIRQEILQLIEKTKDIFQCRLPDVLDKIKENYFHDTNNEDNDDVKLEIEKNYFTEPDTEKRKLETDTENDFKLDNDSTKEDNLLTVIKDIDAIKKKINSRKRLPICKVCNKVFERISELTEHRQTQEHLDAHNKSAKFECGECGKKFTKKYGLECHLPLHIENEEYTGAPIDNTEYFCENCNFKTDSQAHLNRHKQIHSSLKPFKCPCCDKRFAQSSSVNRHLPVHTGERRFQCDACGRQFNAHSSFRRHKLIHENKGAKIHECPNCTRKYAHRYNMDAHIKKKHFNIDKKIF